MKKLLITSILLTALMAGAQQEVMVSQYMFNGLFLNPGYAGSHKYVSASLLSRRQWVDFPGAPRTFLAAIDGEVKGTHMGLGLILANDRIGATDQTDVYGNYSYKIKVAKGYLALGLKAGVSNYRYRNDQLTIWDNNDPLFTGRTNVWIPKFSTGLYYYTEKYYAGISIPNLIAYDPQETFGIDVTSSSFLRRHFFFNGGYVFTLNELFKLKPTALVKYQPTAPLQADFTLNLMFKDQIWVGAAYRTGDALTFLVEYQANARFRVGYAYDVTTTRLNRYSSGTHEVMLGYDFGKDLVKIKSPRFF